MLSWECLCCKLAKVDPPDLKYSLQVPDVTAISMLKLAFLDFVAELVRKIQQFLYEVMKIYEWLIRISLRAANL